MIYVFFGKDSSGVREKALAFIQTLTTNESEVVKITDEGYREGMLADLAESVSLFGGVHVVLLDTPSSDAIFKEGVEDNMELLKDSPNHFVVVEGGLLAGPKKLYTKYAEHIEEIESAPAEKFNAFGITDAFCDRDKKRLWVLLMEEWGRGEANESIVGRLFWQIKILRLAERTSTAEEAGQSSYTYNKAKRALVKFKKGELDTISRNLLELYHAGHGGKVDMSVALEKWVLSI